MQQTCFCFPTEIPPKRSSVGNSAPSPVQKFAAYISSLDLHIAKGIQNQNSKLSQRCKQMLAQIREVHSEQSRILQEVRNRENYFEQNYYKFLKDDIHKFAKYNDFFKKEFEDMETCIAQGEDQNRRRRVVVAGLKTRLMTLLKDNRQAELERKRSVGNRSICRATPTTIQTTDLSLRVPSEPDQRLQTRTHRLKNSMGSCRQLPKLSYRYLQPINQSSRKQLREESRRCLDLLLDVFTFRKGDRDNKQWNWLEQLIFNPRNFEKIVQYVRGRIDYLRLCQS